MAIAAGDLVEDGGDGWVLVAGHYPLLVETPGYILTEDRRLRNAALRLLMEQQPTRFTRFHVVRETGLSYNAIHKILNP